MFIECVPFFVPELGIMTGILQANGTLLEVDVNGYDAGQENGEPVSDAPVSTGGEAPTAAEAEAPVSQRRALKYQQRPTLKYH